MSLSPPLIICYLQVKRSFASSPAQCYLDYANLSCSLISPRCINENRKISTHTDLTATKALTYSKSASQLRLNRRFLHHQTHSDPPFSNASLRDRHTNQPLYRPRHPANRGSQRTPVPHSIARRRSLLRIQQPRSSSDRRAYSKRFTDDQRAGEVLSQYESTCVVSA